MALVGATIFSVVVEAANLVSRLIEELKDAELA